MPANRHFSVVCTKDTRTHSGHICGTPDAPRRRATHSDPTFRPNTIASIHEIPAKRLRWESELAISRPPLHREGIIGIAH
jgi:hypothetical protein